MAKNITIDLDKDSFKKGLKLCLIGLVVSAYALARSTNNFVRKRPWAITIAITIIYMLLSVFLFVTCRHKQVTAEYQRDSISYEYQRVTANE